MGRRSKSSSSKKNKANTSLNKLQQPAQPLPTELLQELPELEPINYEFVNKQVSVHLLCPQCKQLFKNPMRLHPCGHTFCQQCLPTGKCLQCQAKVKVVQKDLIGEGLVEGLIVKCLNRDCPFKDTLEVYLKYHKGSCKLTGGLDEWIKSMESIVAKRKKEEQSQIDSAPTKRKSEEDHNEKSAEGPGAPEELNWEEETCKQIKKL